MWKVVENCDGTLDVFQPNGAMAVTCVVLEDVHDFLEEQEEQGNCGDYVIHFHGMT